MSFAKALPIEQEEAIELHEYHRRCLDNDATPAKARGNHLTRLRYWRERIIAWYVPGDAPQPPTPPLRIESTPYTTESKLFHAYLGTADGLKRLDQLTEEEGAV